MALQELTEDQLFELSDDELAQRMKDEEADRLEDNDTSDEPEDVVDEGDTEPEPEVVEDDVEPDDEVDDSEEDDSDTDEGQPDTEPKAEEEQTESEEPATQAFAPVRIGGRDIPINSQEELYALASAGGQFTQKMQEISHGRKSLAIMQRAKLSDEDLNLYAEAMTGNKDAIAAIVKRSGVDLLEVEEKPSEGYVPANYAPTEQQMQIEDVQNEISRDAEYPRTLEVVNQEMDKRSQEMLVKNPDMIRGIHHDIKTGVYDAISAEAYKLKVQDQGRHADMDYYMAAARGAGPQGQAPQQQQQEEAPVKRVSKSKKKAAAGGSRSKTPSPVINYDTMDDDELMKRREAIMFGN